MATIGFIGLGNMGAHMARNLIKAGHDLKVYDLNDETVRYVAQAGAKAAESAADAATEVEFVVTMLPVGANVRAVLQDAGVIDAVAPGTVLIDSSTIDVETARAMHDAVAGAGYEFLDAPVSGGVGGAEVVAPDEHPAAAFDRRLLALVVELALFHLAAEHVGKRADQRQVDAGDVAGAADQVLDGVVGVVDLAPRRARGGELVETVVGVLGVQTR